MYTIINIIIIAELVCVTAVTVCVMFCVGHIDSIP